MAEKGAEYTLEERKVEYEITMLIEEYNMTPYDINNGNCEEFAMEIIKRIGGYSSNLTELSTLERYFNKGYPGHVWVFYNNRHYDAECPIGKTKWQYLPIFCNFRKSLKEVNRDGS